MTTTAKRNETTPTATPTPDETPTTPAADRSAAREDIARAILATLAPRDRREVFRGVRSFLHVLRAANIVEAHHRDITRALDAGSTNGALEHAKAAADALATVLHASPLRHAHAAVTAALVGAAPVEAAHEAGYLDGGEGAAQCREALRALRRAYQSAKGSP